MRMCLLIAQLPASVSHHRPVFLLLCSRDGKDRTRHLFHNLTKRTSSDKATLDFRTIIKYLAKLTICTSTTLSTLKPASWESDLLRTLFPWATTLKNCKSHPLKKSLSNSHKNKLRLSALMQQTALTVSKRSLNSTQTKNIYQKLYSWQLVF
jgi:hypothetical protein